MDSQGRARLIVGGLSLAAVLLVITLLLTQQNGRPPAAIESPLNGEGLATPAEAVQADSPLDAPRPTSPLAVPGHAVPVAATSTLTPSSTPTSTVEAGESAQLTTTEVNRAIVASDDTVAERGAVTSTATSAVSVTAQSTVTVTLAAPMPVLYAYEVITSYPHDPNAFTQGLQYVDGVLYEGTGLYGQSTLRRVDLESGTVEQQITLPDQYFGEGIVVLADHIYQLTWKSRVAFLYDRESFELVDQFNYPTEGWGLTFDGEDLLMSDGSATIVRRDPATFAEVGRFTVLEQGAPVNLLNELEYIEGELWANVWQTDEIVIIDPENGEVTGRIDFAGLLPAEDAAGADVLNGIAYDEEEERIFITGKFWPTLFEVQLVRRDPSR